ncbi:UDP-glucosyltransferase 2-like [Zerene cesonia]|uniref:UDP-glucosyltransferase 2-like n=1 Tax=Zerene cesonia TaxID=33412 RepID=UPI0018E55596|nr:UDP-glucosyltransferase 2-like [Zerene cesonia]
MDALQLTVIKMRSTLLLIVLLALEVHSARILVMVPTPSISHQVVFRPLIQELLKRGHECVVITTDPVYPKGETPKNLTEVDIHDLSYSSIVDILQSINGDKDNYLTLMSTIFHRMSIVLEKQVQLPEVKEVLDSGKFDMIIGEAYIRPLLGLSHYLKAPAILLSTFGGLPTQYNLLGAPTHPILFPYFIQTKLYNLSFFEKMIEIFNYIRYEWNSYCLERIDFEIMRRNFGDDVPSFKELYRNNVHLLFLNEHPLWADNRPVPPIIKYIGGIHTPEEKPLPKELKDYLDAAKRGVIYFSLGSNVKPSLLPANKINLILNVLSKMPYEVLFKWDSKDYPPGYDNINFFTWIPQSDLLRHQNIKVFITQAGLQSTDEAIDAAVPLIAFPIFGDQFYNSEKYVKLNVGLQLDISSVTEEEFRSALSAVTGDVKYVPFLWIDVN